MPVSLVDELNAAEAKRITEAPKSTSLIDALNAQEATPSAPALLSSAQAAPSFQPPTDNTGLGAQVKAGVLETKQSFGNVLQMLGSEHALNVEGLRKYGSEVSKNAAMDLQDIPSPEPIAEALASGNVGRMFHSATQSLARAVPQVGAIGGIAALGTIGAVPAAIATGTTAVAMGVLGAGDVYAELRSHGMDRPDAAALAGIGIGALNALPVSRLIGRGQKLLGVAEAPFLSSVLKSGAKTAADVAAMSAASAGVVEATKGAVGVPDDAAHILSRIVNAGASGALLGGVTGMVATSASMMLGQKTRTAPYREPKPSPLPAAEPTPVAPGEPPTPTEPAAGTAPKEAAFEAKQPDLNIARGANAKKSIPGLAVDVADAIGGASPEEMQRQLRGEPVGETIAGRMDKAAQAIDSLEVRGVDRAKQDSLIAKFYSSKYDVPIDEAKAAVAAYRPIFDRMKEGTRSSREQVIVTYPGPEAPVMDTITRLNVPDAKVFVAPATISTPVVKYGEGKYLLSVADMPDFKKALGGAVVGEALRKMPKNLLDSVVAAFQHDSVKSDIPWSRWVVENLNDPRLDDVRKALEDYHSAQQPTENLQQLQDYIGMHAALPVPHQLVTELVQHMQAQTGPLEPHAKEEITSIDPSLSASKMTADDLNAQEVINNSLTGLSKRQSKTDLLDYQSHMLKANWFHRNVLTLLQMAKENAAVKPFVEYVKTLQDFQELKNTWIHRATDTTKLWMKLGPEQIQRMTPMLFDATIESSRLERALTGEELDARMKAAGLNDKAQTHVRTVLKDFGDYLDMVRQEMLARADRNLTGEPLERIKTEINADLDLLRNRTYFPLTRFGNFVLAMRAKRDMMIEGKQYKEGDLYSLETYDTQKERDQRATDIPDEQKAQFDVGLSRMTDAQRALIGFPPSMVESLSGSLGLTVQQISELREYVQKFAPGRGIAKHFLKRKSIEGFSRDAIRAYNDYFMSASSNIARVKYADSLLGSIDGIKELAKQVQEAQGGGNSDSLQMLHDYASTHYYDMMNPEKDYSLLKHGIFTYFFAGNLMQPLINMTQVPFVTYPYLVAKYGRMEATTALAKAYAAEVRILQKPELSNPNADYVFDRLTKTGTLDESYASTVAGISSGDILNRTATGTTPVGRAMTILTKGLTWPFQATELLNRRVTARAITYLLEDMPKEQQFEDARTAIQDTHMEMAKWNRPQAVRSGLPAVAYSMKSFQQGMLYNIARQPGGREAFAYMIIASGALGIPFMKDAIDLGQFFTALGKKMGLPIKDPDVMENVQEALHNMGVDYNWVLHGAGRYSMGLSGLAHLFGLPLPAVDVSSSIGMGQIIPGARDIGELGRAAIGEPSGRSADAMMASSTADLMGAGGSIVTAFYKAITSQDPNRAMRMVNALPLALRRMVRAARAASSGQYQDSSGHKLDDVDTSDPEQMAELAAYGLGFTPTRIAVKQETGWAQRESVSYWLSRKDMILNVYAQAIGEDDKSDMSDARKALLQYNREAPVGMKVSGADVSAGLRIRLKNRVLADMGLPRSKRLIPEYQRQADLYSGPQPSPEEISSVLPHSSAQ